MGVVFVQLRVAGSAGASRQVRFLVDSGATYSQLPREIWSALKLAPQSDQEFTLADGTLIKRAISECLFEYQQIKRHSPVILGDQGDPALLGTVTLRMMGLVLNPFKRTLQPRQMMLP